MRKEKRTLRVTPYVNVTPLIDVLLVLLIIFMVVSPLKPSSFKAQVPEPPTRRQEPAAPDTMMLVVEIKEDGALELNKLGNLGTISDTGKLSAELSRIIEERKAHHAYRPDMLYREDLPEGARIQKTVFIKAPKSMAYGEVAKVIDGIRGAGAEPIGLQLDELN